MWNLADLGTLEEGGELQEVTEEGREYLVMINAAAYCIFMAL